jgi:hypothetical protein
MNMSTRTPPAAFRPSTVFHDGPPGLALLGVLPEHDQRLLRSAYEASLRALKDEWEASLAGRATFWINLWQRSGDGDKVKIDRVDEIDAWARSIAGSVYPDDPVVVDGYGWMVNPMGSRPQEWHIDYTLDYSNILIPLSPLTVNNCTQYVVLPPSVPGEVWSSATADLDRVDIEHLVQHCDYVSVRQLLARSFSVIKLDFQTIHRAISNTGDFHRTVFWIAVKKESGELLPAEPLVEIAH